MHEQAFRQLGGVPEEILYDRMKTVWVEIDERGEVVWNPVFLDFARYWGFTPRLCRPYRAQAKGKVESGVKYVRRNFLCGLQGREPSLPHGSECTTKSVGLGSGEPARAWHIITADLHFLEVHRVVGSNDGHLRALGANDKSIALEEKRRVARELLRST